MLLETLVVENYGVYARKSEIGLSTTPKKPIILIGGLNGAGKTTIFESIMVALYGKTYLGAKTTKKEYLEFIASRIHKPRKGRRARHASVEVSFRFYHGGNEDTYTVIRSWDMEGLTATESLAVKKNGEPMSEVNESLWQSFIESLIPIGIARLFFFDGEKIVRVTEWDNGENSELRSALDILLGTEFINRLDDDLSLYAVRKSGSGSKGREFQRQYEYRQEEKVQTASAIEVLESEREKKVSDLEDLESRISSKELKIAGLGGDYAGMRSSLFAQKAVLEEKTRHQGKAIQEELAGDAPLYMGPALLKGIRDQIGKDTAIMQQRYSADIVSEKLAGVIDDLYSEKFWGGPVNKDVLGKLSDSLNAMTERPKDREFFDMSPVESGHMLQKIDGASKKSKALAKRLDEYGKTRKRLVDAESDLAKIPKDDEIGPRITEINRMHQEKGMLESEIAHIGQEISAKNAYLKIVKSKLRDSVSAMHKGDASGTGLKLAARMQKALRTYHDSLKERKMSELESNLLDTIRILLHKKLVSKVEIDRKTLEIRVYRDEGDDEPIPGGLLSMGERQMVGTALLWAIARTCGRALPFVIDTPLGRLDGEHLANLTDRFYPFVSHQLVLLSTDREIGIKEYERLSKYISHSYRISYDNAKSATAIRSGYFMEVNHVA